VDKVQALANPVSLFQQEIVNLLLRRKTMFVGSEFHIILAKVQNSFCIIAFCYKVFCQQILPFMLKVKSGLDWTDWPTGFSRLFICFC